MYTFIHNSNCSKSHAAFEWLIAQQISFEVRNYMEQPLTKAEIKQLVALLKVKLIEIVRTTDRLWIEQYATVTDEAIILDILSVHPSLVQRPILVSATQAAIGRPLENIIQMVTTAS